MFNWYFRYRKRQLEIELAGLEAQYENELDIGNKTGEVYPTVLGQLSRRIGEIKEELKDY